MASKFCCVRQKENQWYAEIRKDCVTHHSATGTPPELAARAYENKAVELFKDKAHVNFPQDRKDA